MSRHPTGLRRLLGAGTLAGALLVLVLPLASSAHSELQSSDPTAGAVVAGPFKGPVAMTFTESLAVGSKAGLYGPGHQLVASATIDAGTMTISPPSPLPAGDYSVEWMSIADDGDVLRGTLAFSVATPSPSAETTATAGPSATSSVEPSAAETSAPSVSPSPGAASPSPGAASPSPSPGPTTGTGGTGSDMLLPIVIVLIMAAAGAAYLVRRNRP